MQSAQQPGRAARCIDSDAAAIHIAFQHNSDYLGGSSGGAIRSSSVRLDGA